MIPIELAFFDMFFAFFSLLIIFINNFFFKSCSLFKQKLVGSGLLSLLSLPILSLLRLSILSLLSLSLLFLLSLTNLQLDFLLAYYCYPDSGLSKICSFYSRILFRLLYNRSWIISPRLLILIIMLCIILISI